MQFRVGSRGVSAGVGKQQQQQQLTTTTLSSHRNLDRCEAIRKQLGYTKLPVLRIRKRSLFFGECGFDIFVPGSASLGQVGSERVRDLDPDLTFPKLKIDTVQNFPNAPPPSQ